MQENGAGLPKDTTSNDKICVICNKIITKDDLAYFANDSKHSFTAHFRCYVEIQEKICSECGAPFRDQEKILYCEEHREYFHTDEICLQNHFEKHLRFKECIYDAAKNRITLVESKDSYTDY